MKNKSAKEKGPKLKKGEIMMLHFGPVSVMWRKL
jgi:hypothetical protein